MQADVERVLIDRDRIATRLDELAAQIADDLHQMDSADDAELTLVPVLTGSIIFVSDLIRRLPLRMRIHTMSASSYPGRATTSQGVSLNHGLGSLPESLSKKHILILDDILDSGTTLEAVHDHFAERNPASIRSCVLLRKQREQPPRVEADYTAFDIPDAFVVGYGLDFDGYYRNLPDIVTLRREVYEPVLNAAQFRTTQAQPDAER